MLSLSKSELRLIAKKRSASGYKNMSKDELIDAINISKPAKITKRIILNQKGRKSKRRTPLNKTRRSQKEDHKNLEEGHFLIKKKRDQKESYETLKEEDP